MPVSNVVYDNPADETLTLLYLRRLEPGQAVVYYRETHANNPNRNPLINKRKMLFDAAWKAKQSQKATLVQQRNPIDRTLSYIAVGLPTAKTK